MNNYKFSVSICVYGGDSAEHFDLAMQSIFNQSLVPDEVVLVVDGPVGDEINNVILKYQNEILKVIRLEKNVGLGKARNISLEHSSHNLVALMDADDISVSERFEKQIRRFEIDDSISLVGGQIQEFIDNVDNVVGIRKVPCSDIEIKEYMKKRCPINHVSVMLKKDDVNAAGGYLDWHYNEDYYLWIRMSLKGFKFINVPENLVNVRVGKDMYQRRGGIKYFKSEAGIQKLMFNNKMISISRYFLNVLQRLILQVLMPNSIRGFIFKKFARDKVDE